MSKISFNASRSEDNDRTWMEQLLSRSPCPILRVSKEGKVLYANEAAALLMKLNDTRPGNEVPLEIGKFVRKALRQQSPCKLKLKGKNRNYFLMFSPVGEEYVHIYGLDSFGPDSCCPDPCGSSLTSGYSAFSSASLASLTYLTSPFSFSPGNPWESESELPLGTERQSEKALKMQKMLWTAINNSPAVVFFWRNEDKWPAEFVSENVTQFGYTVEDFISGNVLYGDIIHREDIDRVCAGLQRCIEEDCDDFKMEYRIFTKDGELRWVDERTFIQRDSKGNAIHLQGVVVDISERKAAEKALEKAENFRKKEIHHRIKNNLQVISSLLDLQAEQFKDKKVVEAFRESESRVISISLIHEELYKSGNLETLNFSSYLHKLTEDLFQAYDARDSGIRLNMDADSVFMGVDTAVSLGIIINEMLINSLKYAFPVGSRGDIRISLLKENPGGAVTPKEKNTSSTPSSKACVGESAGIGSSGSGSISSGASSGAYEYFKLVYADNGKGLPENIDVKNPGTLGLQLVNTLVEQLEGELDLERSGGTKFTIRFRAKTLSHEALTS